MLDKLNSLTPLVKKVALDKETEAPFTSQYHHYQSTIGSYLCRRCGLKLWASEAQFDSHCGWPSFDRRFRDHILEQMDDDGHRTEILCQRCQSHLGHVFKYEGFTPNNHRDCVNSVMLDFVPNIEVQDTEEIIVAGGCFWGIAYLMQQETGVLFTECGYIGGDDHPNYEHVCTGNSGHYESVRVIFDIEKTNSHQLYQAFFEIHDPTQIDGQGPDIGSQYQSAIFYYNDIQKNQALKLIQQLELKKLKIATKILPVSTFWPAEEYHQNYYQTHQKQPYCHRKIQRF